MLILLCRCTWERMCWSCEWDSCLLYFTLINWDSAAIPLSSVYLSFSEPLSLSKDHIQPESLSWKPHFQPSYYFIFISSFHFPWSHQQGSIIQRLWRNPDVKENGNGWESALIWNSRDSAWHELIIAWQKRPTLRSRFWICGKTWLL